MQLTIFKSMVDNGKPVEEVKNDLSEADKVALEREKESANVKK